MIFGGIEAGGTKFVCAVGSEPGDIREEIQFPTTRPRETIGRAIDFFNKHNKIEPIQAIGIGSFGPVDPDPDSTTFGFITSTPKPGWSNTNIAGAIKEAFNVPVGFDTDVNAAALGENMWGAARGLDTFIYLTIGTGIGGGGMVNGKLMHGLIHPEMGHIRIPRDAKKDPFQGICPFHGDCLEGLAAGPAIKQRWSVEPKELPSNHPAWELEAHYLAFALVNFICTLSPQLIILGGGVMQQKHMFSMVRAKVLKFLNEYVQSPKILDGISRYIVPPGLGNKAGVMGSIALARLAAGELVSSS